MYRTMENTGPVAALFYVALVVLGEVGRVNKQRYPKTFFPIFAMESKIRIHAR